MKQPLNLVTAPLDRLTLIEASAGTGKTYTLTALFVRLLLEKELTVDQILVVTFTDAATEELRGRIRARLGDTAEVLRETRQAKDDFETGLLTRLGESGLPDMAVRLEQAVRNFDLAQIFTIHGFCQRMLGKNGFECQALFDTELVPDLTDLRRQVCVDFWRRHILPLDGLTGRTVREQLTPDHLMELAGLPFLAQPIRLEPDTAPPDPGPLDQSIRAACQQLCRQWAQTEDEVRRLFLDRLPTLNKRKFSLEKLNRRLGAVREFIHDPGLDVPDPVLEMTTGYVATMPTAKTPPPDHPLFTALDRIVADMTALAEILTLFTTSLRRRFLQEVTASMDERKQLRGVQGFDDLLRNMHRALASPDLVAAARAQYRAALIDEFQDTDGLQYDIFRTLFAPQDHDGCLFLIGDPKQAIYSFRGADLHTYLTAAEACDRRLTLDVNHRSTPELIQAVHSIFSGPRHPFLHPKIGYQPVQAPDKSHDRFTDNGQTPPPLVLWQARSGDKPVAKGALQPLICQAVTAEISRLLNGSVTGQIKVGDQPLLPGHIAILVETHMQGEAMHQALDRVGIPSVVTHTQSVWSSPEAGELLAVLQGMAECHNQRALRTALAMPLVGFDAADLARLDEDSLPLDQVFERFFGYRELWEKRGVMAATRRLFADFQTRKRLVGLPGGERRMTNVLHCLELLHARERDGDLSMHLLLTWFARQLDNNTAEEAQLRLDTDRDAVQIVTIHKSKGLQYPVVFCPFVHGKARTPEDRALVHENGLLLDLGSERMKQRQAQALTEAQAEKIRLLYVALTRAKARCYLVWGRINEAETSGAAWVFHGHRQENGQPMSWAAITEDMVCADLQPLAGQAIEVADLPGSTPRPGPSRYTLAPELSARVWSRALGPGYGLSSFTGLTRGAEHLARPGLDEDDKGGLAEDLWTMANFPRGAAAGSCLHQIFERIDFTDRTTIPAAVSTALSDYGFDPAWQDTVESMVETTLSADLGGFRLGDIGPAHRLVELEFLFPLRHLTRDALAAVYRDAAHLLPPELPEHMESLRFEPRRGFMTGFVDLVVRSGETFYLLDWKSNWLGPAPGHYTSEAVRHAMTGNHYFLQYHLYCLALNRHLGLRLPGYDPARHFGGVRYVFLRGIEANRPGQGVFQDRPDPVFLGELDQALIGREER